MILVVCQVNSMVVPEDTFRAKMRQTANSGILSAVLQKTQVQDKSCSMSRPPRRAS